MDEGFKEGTVLTAVRSAVNGIADEHSWTTGGEEDVSHVRLIDCGATSEVHEVNLSLYNRS
jgi:hypothetical protein